MSSAFSMHTDDKVSFGPLSHAPPPSLPEPQRSDHEQLLIQRISEKFQQLLTDSAETSTPHFDPPTDCPVSLPLSPFTDTPSVYTFPPLPTRAPDPVRPTTPQKAFIQPVDDWLSIIENLSPVQLSSAPVDETSLTLVTDFLLADVSDKVDLTSRIYETLLRFLRSADDNLTRFVVQLYPALIWRHFLEDGRPGHAGVSALLLAVYQLGTVDETGNAKLTTFVMPSMNYSSLYHRAQELPRKVINQINRQVPTAGSRVPAHSYPFIVKVTSATRWSVFAYMTRTLAECLAHCNKTCHRSIITVTQRLLQNSIASRTMNSAKAKPEIKRPPASGRVDAIAAAIQALRPNLDKLSAHIDQLKDKLLKPPIPTAFPLIHFPARFLVDWTNLLYTLMYQGYLDESFRLIRQIQQEAEFRLLPDVLLVTGAVLNRAETTVSASNYDELLPRADVQLAETARRDLQRDISIAAKGIHHAPAPGRRGLRGNTVGNGAEDVAEDIRQLLATMKLNETPTK